MRLYITVLLLALSGADVHDDWVVVGENIVRIFRIFILKKYVRRKRGLCLPAMLV